MWRSSDRRVKIITGDCLQSLRGIGDGAFQTCVTSPPYYGLRDYGTGVWEGGDPGCPHKEDVHQGKNGQRSNRANTTEQIRHYKSVCGKCGAVRVDRQIGLEETPGQYVTKLVAVFREVRRVLRDDGTVWLNLGDSYVNNESGRNDVNGGTIMGSRLQGKLQEERAKRRLSKTFEVPQKNLLGIPWMVAFALQADGWYLRQDIIWHKPNPMPESVTDRCTKAHEYIFLLAKSGRYFYDAEAIKEKATTPPHKAGNIKGGKNNGHLRRDFGTDRMDTVWGADGLANKRSVWTVNLKSYAEAHFATFPTTLIKPCVLAGCPEGGRVLDPFGGAGTTAVVAVRHNRKCTLLELNPKYVELAKPRIEAEVSKRGFFR